MRWGLVLHRTTYRRAPLVDLPRRCGSLASWDAAPQWCERHHIIPWGAGGPTNLDNLTLLCRFHHHQFEKRGWTCQLNPDRLPIWIPPKWVDRQQRPILHHRIKINNWRPQDPLDLN